MTFDLYPKCEYEENSNNCNNNIVGTEPERPDTAEC